MGQDPHTGAPIQTGLPLATSSAAPATVASVGTPAPAVIGATGTPGGTPATAHANFKPTGAFVANPAGTHFQSPMGNAVVTHGTAGGHVMRTGPGGSDNPGAIYIVHYSTHTEECVY